MMNRSDKLRNHNHEHGERRQSVLAAVHAAGKNRLRCLGLASKGRSKGKALLRFDSATHFRANQPRQSTGSPQGSLCELHNACLALPERKSPKHFDSATHFPADQPRNEQGSLHELQRQHPALEEPTSVDAQKSSASSLGQYSDSGDANTNEELCTYVNWFAGTWAHGCAGDAEFAESLASGLSRVAIHCVATDSLPSAEATKVSPWAAVAAMTQGEHRALAAVVAALLLNEAREQQRQKQQQKQKQQKQQQPWPQEQHARQQQKHEQQNKNQQKKLRRLDCAARERAPSHEPHPPSAARPGRFSSHRRGRSAVAPSTSAPFPQSTAPVAAVLKPKTLPPSSLSDDFLATLVRHGLKATRPRSMVGVASLTKASASTAKNGASQPAAPSSVNAYSASAAAAA